MSWAVRLVSTVVHGGEEAVGEEEPAVGVRVKDTNNVACWAVGSYFYGRLLWFWSRKTGVGLHD